MVSLLELKCILLGVKWRVIKYVFKVVIGWEIGENNLQKVVKKSGQQETIEQLEEGKQQMSAVANQLLSTPSLKVLWFKWKLYYLVTVFMTLKL